LGPVYKFVGTGVLCLNIRTVVRIVEVRWLGL